jgi:hypothetical protein
MCTFGCLARITANRAYCEESTTNSVIRASTAFSPDYSDPHAPLWQVDSGSSLILRITVPAVS